MILGDPKTCVYQFTFDEYYIGNTQILQYFVMRGLGVYIKINSYVAHIFYA